MSNLEITLKIEGLGEMAAAINVLAGAIGMKKEPIINVSDVGKAVVNGLKEAVAPIKPLNENVPKEVPQAPVQTPQPTTIVPTTEPEYTLEQLALAASPIMETPQGMEQLQALLAQFNVPSLAQLDKSMYGAFATSIHALGAKI